jgi:hypothetical protein
VPWGRDNLEYDGLCSHSPLIERPRGDHNLSAEELESQATEWARRKMEKNSKWNKEHRDECNASGKRHRLKNKAAKRFHCEICAENLLSRCDFKRHEASRKHKARVAHAKAVAEGRPDPRPVKCDLCKRGCTEKSMKRHLTSDRHVRNVEAAALFNSKLS